MQLYSIVVPVTRSYSSLRRPRKKVEESIAEMAPNHFFFHLLIVLSIFTLSRSDVLECVYTVYVRTGSNMMGGTDSTISLSLYDKNSYGLQIKNLEAWGGLMGPGYNYFERDTLDIFSGRGVCLTGPVCAMNLTSDGSGSGHGWYVNYVEVTTTGVHQECAKRKFTVEQWLATDTSPYELTATRNYCSSADSEKRVMDGSDLTLVSVV